MKNNLTNFWVVLVSLFNVINGLETQTQINTGCQDQTTNKCDKSCSSGFINCIDKNNIQCEYGYFKLTVENEIHCVQCPFNVEDSMIYMCMDCKENSETWQYSRQCTYNYIISNGNIEGTFLRQNISEPQLYSVIQSASTNQNFLFSYSVDICMGCDIFCFISQGIDDCQQTFEPIDAIYDGVRCKDGFYFQDSSCQQCTIANCMTCDPYSDQPCSGCFVGYTYNQETQSCVKCFDGCIECDGSICITCIQNDDQYLIPTNYGETCSECNYGCARCQVYYDEDYNEMTKCTQCQTGYILHPKGTYCEWCSITECEICYYEYTVNSEPNYTYYLNFVFSDTEQLEQKCYKCKDGFQPDANGKCKAVQNKIDYCQNQKDDDFCFQCEDGFLQESDRDGVQSCSDNKCDKVIKNCLSCMSFYLNDQKQIQCLKCQNGYYPDVYSGLCVQCQSRCDICWQYTNNYNITSYLQLQLFVLEPDQFLDDIKSIEKEQLNDPYCSKCQDGFDLYSNQCQGCTENCVEEVGLDSISQCEYLEDVAYCSKCLSPGDSQSLTSDNSECNECPANCIACRERSRQEIDLVNSFFNPDYSQILRFSNFCYKYSKLSDTLSLTQSRYIDSSLGVPITCEKKEQYKSCYYEVNYQTNIQCGLDLENKMKKSKNSQYTIFLKDLENAQKYNKYNSQQVTNIEIDLQFQMDEQDECKFIKPVIIQSKLKQNIFTLKTLTITISSGSNEMVTFKQAGSMTFEDYSRVTIKNIKFKDHTQGNFGIKILGKQTQIIMINCIIDKTSLQSSFSLLLQNTIFMQFSKVHFEKLRNENFINQTSTTQVSQQCQYLFEDVEFIDCEVNDVALQVNQIGKNNLLSLKNILFKKVKFVNTQVFSDVQDNPSYQVMIDNFQLIQCSLINSSIFNFALVNDFKASNLESVLTLYKQNSNFIVSTALNIENLFAYRSNFQNGSELIISSAQIYQPDQQNSLQLYYFKKIVFQECLCSNINCLMNIQTPLNTFSIASDILIEQIYITNLQVSDISQIDLNSVTSAAVTIQNVGNVLINDIAVGNSFGLSIFFIGQTELILINEAICFFDIDNTYTYYFEEDEKFANFDVNYDLGIEIQVLLTNPYNNLLPNSIDCAEQKIDNYQFSSYFIYIEGFSDYVELKNIEINNNLFIDRSAIVIKSYQKLQLIQTEDIVLENITISNNRLASTLNGQEMSLIYINSEQTQFISITNLQQNSNHLDQITNSQTSETPLCLLIISPYSSIYLANSYFNYNRITNSKNGLMWIKVDEFILSDCYFYKTNILDYSWLEYLEEHQLYDNDTNIYEDNLKSYFKILSKGVNLNIIAKYIYLDQLTIEYSYGLSGAGIHLEIIDGTIVLRRSKFNDIQSSLEPSHSTEGGCLSINSETSQMDLELQDVSMENCKARQRGGCIHLYPTKFKQNIRISNSSFIQCQSFSYSFFSNPFLESTQTPNVYLEQLQITDNNYDNFVQNVPDINLLEQIELGDTQATAIYYQRTGILSIKSCIFNKLKYVTVLNIIKMTRVYIQDSKFQDITILLLPIIYITFNPQYDSQFEIVATQFIDNFSPNIKARKYDCKNYMQESFKQQIDTQNCDITQYIRNYISFTDNTSQLWNDTEYLKLYENIVFYKYERPQQNDIYYSDTTQIISRFNYTLNSSLINCILSQNLELKDSQQNYYQSFILSLQNVYVNSLVKFDKVDIVNNNCLFCDALFQIIGVEYTNYQNTLIYLNKINCKNNNVYYFGCIFIGYNYLYYINPSQDIIDIDSLNYFNRLLQEDYSDNCVIVNNSIFSGNRVRIGSGLSIDSLNALIMNSIFLDNQASYFGGAIYFVSTESSTWTYLNVYNITFQNNKAQVAAAIYLKDAEVPDIDSLEVYFDQNQAYIDTDNLVEVTQRLTISMKENEQFIVNTYRNMSGDNNKDGYVDNILERIRENITLPFHTIGNYPEKTNLLILPSGQSINLYEYFFEETQEYIPYNWIFRIINLNRFNEAVVNQQDGMKCQIFGRIQSFINYTDSQQFTNNFTIPNEAFYSSYYKGYYADNLQIFFDPYFDKNYFLELKIICDKMEIPVYSEYADIIGYNKNYELILNIRTFPCQKGEVYQTSQCIPCSPLLNQYSVIKDSILCSQFNSDYMLEIGQTSIKLKPGYWRPDYDNDQTQNCENLKENCKGGWVPGNPSCYTGHIGALCESCDLYMTINEERFTQTAAYKCARCAPTMQLNYIVLIATSITSFISMVLAVKGSYFSSMQFIITDTLNKMGVLLESSESDLAVLMKVLTNYFQIIQFIGSFQIDLPSSLTQTAKTGGNPTSSTTTAMDCLYVTMSDLDVLYFRMVWSFIQPTIYIVGFYIIYFIGLLLKLVPYKINIITTALIYQFLYLHPTYVEGFIQLASPRTVSGYQYVQRDVAYRYDSTSHQYYLLNYIMPMLIVWVLVLPCLFMFLVFKNRKTLDTKMTKLIYGFFYLEYELNSYLWEFVKLFQKEFMVIILSYYDEQVTVKGLLLVVVMFLYGFYQIQVSPYSNRRLNMLDRYSTVILSISLAMGVLLKSCQEKDFGYLFIIVGIILILINIPFLISILYCIFEGYIIKLSPILDKIRDILNEKYPNLGQNHPWLKPYLFNRAKMSERVKYLWGVLREAVNDTNNLCQNHKLKFKNVFPPYDNDDFKDQTIRVGEIQPLIEAQQNYNLLSPSLSPEPQTSKIAMQSMLPSGVVQQGQFVTSSFVMNQEQAITGKGVEQWPDNTIYEGQIVNGKKEGKGKVTWPLKDGATQQEYYEGDFKNNQFEGLGIYQWADGKKYEGKWKEGKRDGYGVYQGLNQQYQGEFKNDLYHGQGTLIIGEKKLIGLFENGKLNGDVIVQIGVKKRKGIWKQGKFQQWIN